MELTREAIETCFNTYELIGRRIYEFADRVQEAKFSKYDTLLVVEWALQRNGLSVKWSSKNGNGEWLLDVGLFSDNEIFENELARLFKEAIKTPAEPVILTKNMLRAIGYGVYRLTVFHGKGFGTETVEVWAEWGNKYIAIPALDIRGLYIEDAKDDGSFLSGDQAIQFMADLPCVPQKMRPLRESDMDDAGDKMTVWAVMRDKDEHLIFSGWTTAEVSEVGEGSWAWLGFHYLPETPLLPVRNMMGGKYAWRDGMTLELFVPEA